MFDVEHALGELQEVAAEPFVAIVDQRLPVDRRLAVASEDELLFSRRNRRSRDDASDDEVQVTLLGRQQRSISIDEEHPSVRVEQEIAAMGIGMAEHKLARTTPESATKLFGSLDDLADLVAPMLPDSHELADVAVQVVARLKAGLHAPDPGSPTRYERLAGNQAQDCVRESGVVDRPQDSAVLLPLKIGQSNTLGTLTPDEWIEDQGVVPSDGPGLRRPDGRNRRDGLGHASLLERPWNRQADFVDRAPFRTFRKYVSPSFVTAR